MVGWEVAVLLGKEPHQECQQRSHGSLDSHHPPSSNQALLPLPTGWSQQELGGELGHSHPSGSKRSSPSTMKDEAKARLPQPFPLAPSQGGGSRDLLSQKMYIRSRVS